MADAAMLDFLKFEIFNSPRVRGVEWRFHAQFGRNWSICGRDMVIFRHLGFFIF